MAEYHSAVRSVFEFNANIVIIFYTGKGVFCLCVMKKTVVIALDEDDLSV